MLVAKYSRVAMVAFGLALGGISWISHAAEDCGAAKDRAIQFLTNAHTGKGMRADRWLTSDARNAPLFSGFGGLKALVAQSTERANKYGGLASVTVRTVTHEAGGCQVTAEVTFKRDHREPGNPSASANEDMIWPFLMVKQNGVWKIAK